MVKVLLITGSLHIGGMETVAMNIARYLDKSIFQIDFLVYGDTHYEHEDEAVALGGNVFHIPFPHNSPFTFQRNIRYVIKKNGPYDIVHCHNLFNCGLAMFAAYKEHVPVRISHSHTNRTKELGGFVRRVYENYSRMLMKKYGTDFFACSQKAGIYLFGKDFPEYGFVLRNGVDPTKYNSSEQERLKLKQSLGIEGKKVIIQIGTFDPVKNHLFSVQLMKEVVKKLSNCVLLFAGDGEEYSRVKEAVTKDGLEQNIILLGQRSDVPQLLSISDLYLMPSLYEGVSLALVEAQTSGVPCIVSETACAPEVVISDCITSISLEVRTEEWVNAIITCVNKPRCPNPEENVVAHGYDIREIITELGEKYLDRLSQEKKKCEVME